MKRQTKICSKCKKELPIQFFAKRGGASYQRSECTVCYREIRRNADKGKKNAPPIPDNHKCPICLRGENEVKNLGGTNSGTWCFDHDHVTNNFRNYLCHSCNRLLGGFEDDITKFDRAKEYIIFHRAKAHDETIMPTISDFIENGN